MYIKVLFLETYLLTNFIYRTENSEIGVAPVVLMSQSDTMFMNLEWGDLQKISNKTYTINYASRELNSQINPMKILQYKVPELRNFCPIDEWSPFQQPMSFYLSFQQLAMVWQNNTIHMFELTTPQVNSTFQCYDIIPQSNLNTLAVDCNYYYNKETFFYYIMFTINYNQNNVISYISFPYIIKYKYSDSETNQFFSNNCDFRQTFTFKVFEDSSNISIIPFQAVYCNYPKQTNIYIFPESTLKQLTLRDQIITINEQILSFFNLTGCSRYIEKYLRIQITNIFQNVGYFGLNSNSWNLGVMIAELNGICKCEFSLYPNQTQEIFPNKCDFVFITAFRNQFYNEAHFFNDYTLLIGGSYQNIFAIRLNNNIDSFYNNDVIFKIIYEEDYPTIKDIFVTEDYVGVLLGQYNETSYLWNAMFNNCTPQKNQNQILKIFELNELSSVPYFEGSIPEFTIVLASQTYEKDGSDVCLYYNEKNIIKCFVLSTKFLQVSYTGDVLNNDSYLPFYVNITVEGIIQNPGLGEVRNVQYQKLYIFCVTQLDNIQPQLLADQLFYNLSTFNLSNLYYCPTSSSKIYGEQSLLQVDLTSGLVGPDLYFEYKPNTTIDYDPYYLDQQYIIEFQKEAFISLNASNIYQIYDAHIVTQKQQFSSLATLILDIVYQENKKKLYVLSCEITESLEYKIQYTQNINLSINQCKFNLIQTLDIEIEVFYQFKKWQFFGRKTNCTLYICPQNDNSINICTQITGSFQGQNFTDILLQHSTTIQQIEFYTLIMLSSNNREIFQYQFDIPENQVMLIKNLYIIKNPQIIQATLMNNISKKIIPALNFFYILDINLGYRTQNYLAILLSNFELYILTNGPQGPLNYSNYDFGQFVNYSTIGKAIEIDYCSNFQNGTGTGRVMILKSAQNYVLQSQPIVIICTDNVQQSYLVELMLFTPSNIIYKRQLPLYDAIIDLSCVLAESFGLLFLPVKLNGSLGQSFQNYYYIINIYAFTPSTLYSVLSYENQQNNVFILGFQDSNYYINPRNLAFVFACFENKAYLKYYNPKPEFYGKLQRYGKQEYIFDQEIDVAINQNNFSKIQFYRTYEVTYNLELTQLTTNTQEIKINMQRSQNGYFYGNLVLQANQFSGQILGYSIQNPNTNLLIVNQQSFISVNKSLGNFIETVDQYGHVLSLLNLNQEDYPQIFNIMDSYVNSYTQLIIIATQKYLLFYQKFSYKNEEYYQNCQNFYNSSQQKQLNLSQCNIRLIMDYRFQYMQSTPNECNLYLNSYNSIVLSCIDIQEVIKLNLFKQTQKFLYQYIEFSYFSNQNKITIIAESYPDKLLGQDIISSQFIPFYSIITNQTYQIINLNIFDTTSEIIIGNMSVSGQYLQFDLNQILNGDFGNNFGPPLDLIYDFDVGIFNNTKPLLLMLQMNCILIYILEPGAQFSLQYQLTINDIGGLLNISSPNKYSLGLSYFLEIVSKNITLTQNNTASVQFLLGFGKNFALCELNLNFSNLSNYNLKSLNVFKYYFGCFENLFYNPKIHTENGQLKYVVAVCLKEQINYNTIFQDMLTANNEGLTNKVYIQLFIYNQSQEIINSTEIIYSYFNAYEEKTNMVNILDYAIYTNQIDGTIHLLISNSTLLLVDYLISQQATYTFQYSEQDLDQNIQIYASLSCYNEMSSNSISLIFELDGQEQKNKSKLWIYLTVCVFCFLLISGIIYGIIVRRKKNMKKNQYNESQRVTIASQTSFLKLENEIQLEEMLRTETLTKRSKINRQSSNAIQELNLSF